MKATSHHSHPCLISYLIKPMLVPFHRFFYITHLDNLASIRANGLLSHNAMLARGLRHMDIADPGAQRWRDRPEPIYGRSIHDYVPLYINPRNPMLYVRRGLHKELVIIKISASVADNCTVVYTDGNASSRETKFSASREVMTNSLPALTADSWREYNDGKRLRCAEVLIYPNVQPMYFEGAVCSNGNTAQVVRNASYLVTLINPHMFFQV